MHHSINTWLMHSACGCKEACSLWQDHKVSFNVAVQCFSSHKSVQAHTPQEFFTATKAIHAQESESKHRVMAILDLAGHAYWARRFKKARTQAVCMSRYRSFKTPCHSQLKGNVQFCLFLPMTPVLQVPCPQIRCVASPTRGPWSFVRAWWSDETLMWSNINYTPEELTWLMTWCQSTALDTAVIRILCSNDRLSTFHASHPSLQLMGKLHKI